MMHEGEFNNQISPLHEQETDKPNGVKMVISVQSWDTRSFSNKIREQLAYFSNTYIEDGYNAFNNKYKIYENDLLKWSEIAGDHKMHLCLGEVYYPMDFNKLGISDIHIPIAVKLSLTDKINPTLSRESLMLTPEAKKIILDKIEKIADWFITKYNELVEVYKTYPDAFDYINVSNYYYEIQGRQFNINQLSDHSTISFENPVIEGITLRDSSFYKREYGKLVGGWEVMAQDDHSGTWKKVKIGDKLSKLAIDSPGDVVKVNYPVVGNIKAYLREKYGTSKIYIEERKRSLLWYQTNIGLNGMSKEKWRGYIKEFQFIENQIFERFHNEYNLEGKKEYQGWLEERIRVRKENRERGVSTYVTLNKQRGEVTLNVARLMKRGAVATFDKKTIEISKLNSLGQLSVLVDKDIDRDLLYDYIRAFNNIKFLYLGEREVKHIKDNKHFITMEELKKSKPFARLATALLIEDMFKLIPENEHIIYAAFPKFEELKNRLEEYKDKNDGDSSYVSDNLRKIILEEATDSRNWDGNIYSDILEFRKIISKFGFLSFISTDMDYDTEEEMRVAKNMVYIMLQWQKIEGQLVTDMELVPRIPDEVFKEEEDKATVLVGELEEELVE